MGRLPPSGDDRGHAGLDHEGGRAVFPEQVHTMAPSDSDPTERNAPSVEAAFQAIPSELIAESLDGELHISPHPARPQLNAMT